MISKKLVFTVKAEDKDVELAVHSPTVAEENMADMEMRRVFAEQVRNGVPVQDALNDVLTKQGVWGEDKQKKVEELVEKIRVNALKLKTGRDGEKQLRKVEGKEIAIQIIKDRDELDDVLSIRSRMMQYTAEGSAQNAKFGSLVALCTVYNDTGAKYFKSIDDYKNRADEPASETIATKFYEHFYNVKDDPRKKLPEYVFLTKYGFVNDKLNFVREDGKVVSMDGKLIREADGRFINEENQLINASGQLVDEEGELIVETSEFLD